MRRIKFLLTVLVVILISTIVMSGKVPAFSPKAEEGLNCFFCHREEPAEKDKGCLSCHREVEIKNTRKQGILVNYARQLYGTGKGYECALCHEGNPSSNNKAEAHRGLFPNPSSMEANEQGQGCSKCHLEDASSRMITQMPLPEAWIVRNGVQ